jgi:hypothetical protein
MVDAGHHIYVWAGKDAPPMLKASAIPHAEQYLRRHNRPHVLPITLVKQGMEPEELLACFGVATRMEMERATSKNTHRDDKPKTPTMATQSKKEALVAPEPVGGGGGGGGGAAAAAAAAEAAAAEAAATRATTPPVAAKKMDKKPSEEAEAQAAAAAKVGHAIASHKSAAEEVNAFASAYHSATASHQANDASDANANAMANAAPTLFGDGMMWFVPHHVAVWRKGHPVHSYVSNRSFDY